MFDEDDTTYALALDGRWSARTPRAPEFVGYGPTKGHAAADLLSRRLALGDRATNVLTLVQGGDGWTARATENLALTGVGTSEDEASADLRAKLSPDPRKRWTRDRFTRTVTFTRSARGPWAAESDSGHRVVGHGADLNEAEASLIEAEFEAQARAYDMNADYASVNEGYYKEDDSL